MTSPGRRAKAVLWALAALAAVSFAFPYLSGRQFQDPNKAGAPEIRTVYIEVQGMVQQLGIT